jgi:hypothetical protein
VLRTVIATILIAIGSLQIAFAAPAFAERFLRSDDQSAIIPCSQLADSAIHSSSTSDSRSVEAPVAQPPAPAQWRWRKAGAAEYLGVTAAAAGAIYFEKKNGDSDKAHWTSRNDFDEGIRDALRLGSASGRNAAQTASDVLLGLMIVAPLVDAFATLGMRDARWDALWQTEMINMESFTFTALVSTALQNVVARERPLARDCERGTCGGDELNRSMPSGHVALAFTGAGLLCTHHAYQSLYADPGAERALCATGLAAATVEGFLRVMADQHYATDVLAGTGIGLFSGFLLPRLLHYYWPQRPPQRTELDDHTFFKQVAVTPQIFSGGGGLSLTATY